MDHLEEQNTELETLGYIFPDELDIVDCGPPAVFRIPLRLDDEDLLMSLRLHAEREGLIVDEQQDGDEEEEDEEEQEQDDSTPRQYYNPSCTIEFTFTPTYPETLPEMRLLRVRGIHPKDTAALLESMRDHGTTSALGMAMIFALVSHAKETLESLSRSRMEQEESDRERRILAEEEAERQRYQGTRVTPESFASWKTAFLAEARKAAMSNGAIKLLPAQEAAVAIDDERMGRHAPGAKLTGRQLFEKDRTLVESDAQFMEEGDVAVDVELFEGLEIDDDEEDEEENQVLAGLTDED